MSMRLGPGFNPVGGSGPIDRSSASKKSSGAQGLSMSATTASLGAFDPTETPLSAIHGNAQQVHGGDVLNEFTKSF